MLNYMQLNNSGTSPDSLPLVNHGKESPYKVKKHYNHASL